MSIPLPLFHPYLLFHWISLWQNDGFSFLWEDSPFPLYPHPNSAVLSTTAERSSENLAPLHGARRPPSDSQAFAQPGAPPNLISLSSQPARSSFHSGSYPPTVLSANSPFLPQLSDCRIKGPGSQASTAGLLLSEGELAHCASFEHIKRGA